MFHLVLIDILTGFSTFACYLCIHTGSVKYWINQHSYIGLSWWAIQCAVATAAIIKIFHDIGVF